MTPLITERLNLKPFSETDFETFSKLHADPKLKANTHAKPMNRLQARDLFDGYRDAFAKDGFGMRALQHRDSGDMIGECGLWYRRDVGGYTLRYTITSAYWGGGYSFEAVRAILADAFEARSLGSVQAIAMQHNHRSVRVLQRAGFVETSDCFRGVPGFLRFILTAEAWRVDGGLPPAQGL